MARTYRTQITTRVSHVRPHSMWPGCDFVGMVVRRYRLFERHFVPQGAKDADRSGMTIEIFNLASQMWPSAPAEGIRDSEEAAG
jgi:hypothetical protein